MGDNDQRDPSTGRRVASAVALAGMITAGAALMTTAANAAPSVDSSPTTTLINVTPGSANGIDCEIHRNPCCQWD